MNPEPEVNQHKSIAYTMKAEQEIERQKNQKLLRVIRAHENRLHRLEKHLGIIPSDKEILELGTIEFTKGETQQ